MIIALASDHAGFELKHIVAGFLSEQGHKVQDYGTESGDSVDYPDYAHKAALSLGQGLAEKGILICGSGLGVCISANKVTGVRAVNCLTSEMARLSRQHNNANVLTLGARLVDEVTARDIIKTFLSTEFEGGRHARRVEKIHTLSGR